LIICACICRKNWHRKSPCRRLHGRAGRGVLITGESGLGKSELGLELISRSHGLVADDAVEFSPHRAEHDRRPLELLQNLLEVRGLGLLDIKTIFGETAVRRKMRLKLIVIWFAAARSKIITNACLSIHKPKKCWGYRYAKS
jgi:HPr kinase/phosphorylase